MSDSLRWTKGGEWALLGHVQQKLSVELELEATKLRRRFGRRVAAPLSQSVTEYEPECDIDRLVP